MKTLSGLRTKQVIAESVSQDLPTVLVLRRKAIRLFPHGQRVATYKNDNLDIEIAVPYNPDKLGHSPDKVSGTLASENKEDEFKDYMRMSDSESQRTGGRHYEARKAAGLYVKNKKTPAERIKYFAARDRREANKLKEDLDEAMSPELKRIRKERGMFKRDLTRQQDHLATSKQRLDWAKRALAGHIKKHGKTLDPIGECFNQLVESAGEINEMSAEGLFGEYLHKPRNDLVNHVVVKWGQKAAHHFVKAAEHYGHDYAKAKHHFDAFKRHVSEGVEINELSKQVLGTGIAKATGKLTEEDIMEASIHSLHAITRTQYPAQVRFRDGSSAMIDHPTAAQIMKLHSKVNRQNKKKIESLINGGAAGIKKVSEFARDHMK